MLEGAHMEQQGDELFSQLHKKVKDGTLDRKKDWRLYQQVLRYARKAPHVTEDQIQLLDKIDHLFYTGWKVPKIPINIGTVIFTLLTVLLEIIYWYIIQNVNNIVVAIILYFVFSIGTMSTSHVVIHWLIGKILGINFRSYFIFKSAMRKAGYFPFTLLGQLPTPGIKYELRSFLRATKWKRTLMLSAPPLLLIGFFAVNYWILIERFGMENTLIVLSGLITLLSYVIATVASYLYGDLAKARMDY